MASKLMKAALRMEKRQLKVDLGEVYWDGKSEASDFVKEMSEIIYAKDEDGKQRIRILRTSVYKGAGLDVAACRRDNDAKGESRALEDFMDLHQRRHARRLLRHFLNRCHILHRDGMLTTAAAMRLMDEMAAGAWNESLSDAFPPALWKRHYSLGKGSHEFRRQPGRLCIMPPVGQRVYIRDDDGTLFEAEVVPSKMVPEKARRGKLKGAPHTSFYLVGIGFPYVGGVTEMARAVIQKVVPSGWGQWCASVASIGSGTVSPEALESLATATLIVKKDVERKSMAAPPPKSAAAKVFPSAMVPLEKVYRYALPSDVVNEIEPRWEKKKAKKKDKDGADRNEGKKGEQAYFPVEEEVWQALRDDEVVWPGFVFATKKLAEQWGGGGDARKLTVIRSNRDGKAIVDAVLGQYVGKYREVAESLKSLKDAGVPVNFEESIVEADVVKTAAKAVGYMPRQAADHLEKLACPESEPTCSPCPGRSSKGGRDSFLARVREKRIVNGGS